MLIRAVLERGAAMACLSHALTTEHEEVMGILLGFTEPADPDCPSEAVGDERTPTVATVVSTQTLRRVDRRKDRVEISPEQLSSAIATAEELTESLGTTIRVIGWYHSHPHITAEPSHVDVGTQRSYQYLDPNFLGVIVSCFAEPSEVGGAVRTRIKAFQAATPAMEAAAAKGWPKLAFPAVCSDPKGAAEVPDATQHAEEITGTKGAAETADDDARPTAPVRAPVPADATVEGDGVVPPAEDGDARGNTSDAASTGVETLAAGGTGSSEGGADLEDKDDKGSDDAGVPLDENLKSKDDGGGASDKDVQKGGIVESESPQPQKQASGPAEAPASVSAPESSSASVSHPRWDVPVVIADAACGRPRFVQSPFPRAAEIAATIVSEERDAYDAALVSARGKVAQSRARAIFESSMCAAAEYAVQPLAAIVAAKAADAKREVERLRKIRDELLLERADTASCKVKPPDASECVP